MYVCIIVLEWYIIMILLLLSSLYPPPQITHTQIRGMLKIFTLRWTPQLMFLNQVLTLDAESVGKRERERDEDFY